MEPTKPAALPEPSDFASDLSALKNLIEQIELMLDVPGGKGLAAAREATKTALALVMDMSETPVAAQLGKRGGTATAQKHGVEHYRQMAANRKTYGGGRPKKVQ